MDNFLRVFEAKALAAVLTEAGHSVSERTVQRWKAGKTKPKPQDIRAIYRVLQLADTKEPPPEWARAMESTIVDELKRNRQLIEALALPADIREAAERVIERLEALGPPGGGAPSAGGGSAGQGGVMPRVRELG